MSINACNKEYIDITIKDKYEYISREATKKIIGRIRNDTDIVG